MCAPVIQNKVIRRKRTLRTWSNYSHQKNQLPARHRQEVLLLCQVLLHERGGVWFIALLSWFISFSFIWLSCVLPQRMVHLPDSTLFTVLLPEFLSKFWGFFHSTMIEQSHFIVKECQCTLILLILSYGFTLLLK